MEQQVIWAVVAVAIIAVAVGWYVWTRRRTEELRERFGPEYDHTLKTTGDVRKAEASLAARAKRVERLHIHPLSADESARFSEAWQRIQSLFVDDPNGAISQADRLVGEVMAARGYPIGDFDRRVEDISVDHPDVVMNYRAAREIANLQHDGHASTEDLRQGMVHYRALFRDLLEVDTRAVHDEPAPVAKGRR